MTHELLGCYANIWIRQKKFSAINETIGGHKHKYDHVSLLTSGKVKVEVDGFEKEFTAPTFIVIEKDKIHNVTALTDDVVWYCVFAHRDINGDVYDAELNVPYDKQSCGSCNTYNAEGITINTINTLKENE